MRAHGISIMYMIVLLSLQSSVYALPPNRFKGVTQRKNGKWQCTTTFYGERSRRIFLSPYPTEKLAALACDVVAYYEDFPHHMIHWKHSAEIIAATCSPKSAYDALNSYEEKKQFLKMMADTIVDEVSTPEFYYNWEIFIGPPIRRTIRDTSGTKGNSYNFGISTTVHARQTQQNS